jgi:hypothetical protein
MLAISARANTAAASRMNKTEPMRTTLARDRMSSILDGRSRTTSEGAA